MHQHANHPPLNPPLPLSLSYTQDSALQRLNGWLVGVAPALSSPPSLPWLLSFLCFPPSFTSLDPLPPLRSLPFSYLCHQLGLAGSQAALGSAPLAFQLWHGTTGQTCCFSVCKREREGKEFETLHI